MTSCHVCNKKTEGLTYVRNEPDGYYLCQDCLANARAHQCFGCHNYFDDSMLYYVDSEGVYLCIDCFTHARRCSFCRSLVFNDNFADLGAIVACPDCYERYRRGELCVAGDDTTGVDDDLLDGVEELFEDAGGDDDATIRRHGYTPRTLFYYSHKSLNWTPGVLYMGVELEVDCGNVYQAAEELMQNFSDRVWLTWDSSLDDGFEIITYPASLYYHMTEMDWHGILDLAARHGFMSHDAGTCGLHVHMDYNALGRDLNERDLTVAKILLFYEKNWPDIVRFSRRTSDQLEQFCQRYCIDADSITDEVAALGTLEEVKSASRYHAVNLQSVGKNCTIEFRIFRGTLQYGTLMASLQFCLTLALFAKYTTLTDILQANFATLLGFAKRNKIPCREFEEYLGRKKLLAPAGS